MKYVYVICLNILIVCSCKIYPNLKNTKNVYIQFIGKPVDTQYISNRGLVFTSGFNDSLLIKQNEVILACYFFKTDISQSYTGVSLNVNKKRGVYIEIFDLKSKDGLLIELLDGYKKIEIAKVNDKWSLIYTNTSIIFE